MPTILLFPFNGFPILIQPVALWKVKTVLLLW